MRQLLDMLGGLTVTLEGVTLAVKPAGSIARRPAILEDQLFQALELACEGAAEAGCQGVVLCMTRRRSCATTRASASTRWASSWRPSPGPSARGCQ